MSRPGRAPEESGEAGTYEELEVRAGDLPGEAVRGAVVTVGSVEYVVTDVRRPDPRTGLQRLVLARRA